jgi:hypothetical protein
MSVPAAIVGSLKHSLSLGHHHTATVDDNTIEFHRDVAMDSVAVDGGTAAAPGFHFTGDADTGIYSDVANNLYVSTGGTKAGTFGSTGTFTAAEAIQVASGTHAAPTIRFTGDGDTGLTNNGDADTVYISTGGAKRLKVSSTVVESDEPVHAPDGAVGAPAYSFTDHTDTGVFMSGSNLALSRDGAVALSVGASLNVYKNTDMLTSNTAFRGPSTNSAANPSFTWTNDPDTGLYREGTNSVGVTCGGSNVMTVGSSVLDYVGTQLLMTNGRITAHDGTVGAPTYSFLTDGDTGMYRGGTNVVRLAAGGVDGLAVSKNATTGEGQVQIEDGTDADPAITFVSDTDTGIHAPAANNLAISTGGSRRATFQNAGLSMGASMVINHADYSAAQTLFTDRTNEYFIVSDFPWTTASTNTNRLYADTPGTLTPATPTDAQWIKAYTNSSTWGLSIQVEHDGLYEVKFVYYISAGNAGGRIAAMRKTISNDNTNLSPPAAADVIAWGHAQPEASGDPQLRIGTGTLYLEADDWIGLHHSSIATGTDHAANYLSIHPLGLDPTT